MKARNASRDNPGMAPDLHVIFGAGQVGFFLAQILARRGKRVCVVKRSRGELPPGVDVMYGDAADPAFCRRATTRALVVYHCMNPPYRTSAWRRLVPRYMENLVNAASESHARLVVLDNLYMIGRTGGRSINEDTPVNPVSRKGEIRARAAQFLFDAHRRGDVRAVCGRASDYYGPRGSATHFGPIFWRAALRGEPAPFLPDPDTRHTYHYIPDVAAGLAALGTADDGDLGVAWLLPCIPAVTTRELVGRFAVAIGRQIRLRTMSRAATTALGMVIPLLREAAEMLYQWDEPFVVDDTRFRERFRLGPEDPAVAAKATAVWAQRKYGR